MRLQYALKCQQSPLGASERMQRDQQDGCCRRKEWGTIPEGPEMPRLAATEELAPRPGMPGNPAMLPRAIVCPKVCGTTKPCIRRQQGETCDSS